MELTELKILDLSDGEIKAYSAILSIGIATLNNIHEKVGMERRAIYDILNKLIEKGLVSYTTERGKRTYHCTTPNNILEKINEKEKKLNELKERMPEIDELYKNPQSKIMAEVYRGREGIKAIFEDLLNYKENYFIGSGWYVLKNLPFFWHSYNKRRIEKGVKWYNLLRYEWRNKEAPKEKFIHTKFLPKEFSGNPAVIFIYSDKVANVLWGEEFYAFIIQSKEIAENYKKYHNYLWKKVAISR